MFHSLPFHLPPALRSPQTLTAIAVVTASLAFSVWLLTRRRLTHDEIEQLRRNTLATTGRITDGSITDTHGPEDSPEAPAASAVPEILIYRYIIAGVTYECAQDVHNLPHLVRDVRVDLPIQIRFDPRSPGNSIVVAETWTGLRLNRSAPLDTTTP